MVNLDQIRKLREETGAPVIRVKKVLDEVKGDVKKASEILKKEGFEKLAKRENRQTGQGVIEVYTHHSRKVASVVELFCETDFVARTEVFCDLAHNIALQVASMNPKTTRELEGQEFIKDPSKKIRDLVDEARIKTGENIRIGRFFRVELGH